MQSKNRKINKEELELWKKVTKNDVIIGEYTTSVGVNRIQLRKNIISKSFKDTVDVQEKKGIILNRIPK